MANCPSCGTQVNVDFGMATCPNNKCALIFMVDADGNAAMPEPHEYGDEQSAEAENAQTVVATKDDIAESAPTYVGTDLPSDENLGFDNANTVVDTASSYEESDSEGEQGYQAQEYTAQPTDLYQVEDNKEQEYDENFLSGDFASDASEAEDAATPEDDKNDPMGVQKFDRSAASQLVDGPYYYDVTINGLDTAQIKDEVMRALADKRFQWSSEEIKRKLRNGRLVFKDLNPVKAVLLVIKIQHIDVEIQWVQKMHTDPSVTGGVPGQV